MIFVLAGLALGSAALSIYLLLLIVGQLSQP